MFTFCNFWIYIHMCFEVHITINSCLVVLMCLIYLSKMPNELRSIRAYGLPDRKVQISCNLDWLHVHTHSYAHCYSLITVLLMINIDDTCKFNVSYLRSKLYLWSVIDLHSKPYADTYTVMAFYLWYYPRIRCCQNVINRIYFHFYNIKHKKVIWKKNVHINYPSIKIIE